MGPMFYLVQCEEARCRALQDAPRGCDGTGSNGHPGRMAVGAGCRCPLGHGGVRRVLGPYTRIAFGRFGDLQSGCSADGFPSGRCGCRSAAGWLAAADFSFAIHFNSI